MILYLYFLVSVLVFLFFAHFEEPSFRDICSLVILSTLWPVIVVVRIIHLLIGDN